MSVLEGKLLGALAIGGAAGIVSQLVKKTPSSAREAYEQGSPTASYQAPNAGVPDWMKLGYAQRWALVQKWGFIPVGTSYAGVVPYPITFIEDATRIWDKWWDEINEGVDIPRDVVRNTPPMQFGSDPAWGGGLAAVGGYYVRQSAKEFLRMRDKVRWVSPASDNLGDALPPDFRNYLNAEETRIFWDGLHAMTFTLNGERQFEESAWARLWSSVGAAAYEAPATFAGWVATAGTTVAEAAGDVAGSLAGGILGGLLRSPIGVAALVAGAAFLVLRETK
ncbi:MAG TPA: hypothetical protein VK510_03120 [Solirubrobacteraceae bacterium]|nr:hypothetical protein [Solirubrobacteraceae bacterium]